MLSLRSSSLQAQSPPVVYSLPITISNQGVAYDTKTNLIVATDYKNNVVRLVNLTTGASTSVTVGTRPVAAAVYTTSSKSYAYIGNEGSDNVSVIDLSTKSVIKTISVGQSPSSIAINSSTGKGYVANFKSDNVSILTLSTNIVAATTAVGSEPASVAINTTTNKVYVANSKSDTVSVIDGTSNAVTATIPVGQSPVFVVVNSGKSMAYSVNSKGYSVSAINLSTNAVTATIPVGPEPESMAIDTAKNTGYVANLFNDTVSVFNLSTNTVTGTYAVGRDPIGVAFYSPYLIVATERGDGLWVINTTTQTFGTTVPVGKDPDGIAVDPTTNRALTANEKSNDISIVDISSAQEIATIPVGGHPTAVAINSATQTALVANEKDDTLSVIDLTTKSVIGTIAVGKSPVAVAINQNLNIAISANGKADSVSVVDLSSHLVSGMIAVGRSPSAVAIQSKNNIGVVANRKDNTASILDLSNHAVIATVTVGKDPAGVTIDPDLNIAVVTNYKDNTVSLIDLSTKTVVATITTGKGPRGAGINPSTHSAAIANYIDGTITVIDLPSRKVVQTITAGKSPQSVDINPNTNQAIVTLDSLNLLTILQLNNPVPVISGLIPVSIAAGDPIFTLTVQGSQFITTSVVKFKGQAMATQFVSTTKLTASIPASAITTPGTVPVTVTNPTPGGSVSNTINFSINNPVPIVTSITPTAVLAGSAQVSLTVSGQKFISGAKVTLAGQSLTTTFVNGTQLSATVPATLLTKSGLFGVNVINPAPGGGSSNTINFSVNNPVPVMTSITPTSVQAGVGDTTLTVKGANFTQGSAVQWNDSFLLTSYMSSTQLSVTILASSLVSGGSYSIKVTSPSPGGGSSNIITFTVTNPVPAITSIAPTSVQAGAGNTTLTVNGSKFVGSSTIQWNGASLPTTYVSSSQLSATIPSSSLVSAGSFTIMVANPSPGGGTSNSITFTVNNPVPVISSISPTSVLSGSGSTVLTVNGSNFVGGSTIKWNGVSLATTFVNNARLSATIPSSSLVSAGSFTITVANSAPGGGSSNSITFTVNNPVPAITSIAPTSAVAGSGNTALTVSGSNFTGNSTVQWNGTALATTYVSAGQLSATIPASSLISAGTFTVTVNNPAPGGGASNAITVTVNNPVPSLTTISPASIATGSGSFTLTVNGMNFLPSSIVTYNGQILATTFVSSTQLTATVTASDTAASQTAQIGVVNSAPGGGNATPVNLIVDQLPVADVGTARTALVGKAISLDGRKSSDADGNMVTFAWSIASTPPGSTIQLTNPTSVTPSLTPDMAGTYKIQLIVNDGFLNSVPAFVTVTASSPNAPPNADAGSDQTAVVGQTVALDGRKSFDSNNDQITYQWSIVSAPPGNTASLTDADSVIASLTSDVAGTYVAQLIVNDGTASSQPIRATITAGSPNVAPIARAGKDRSVLTGSLVTLDGSKSHDPDSETISYRWFFVAIPSGSAAIISGATTSLPTFTPDQNGEYLVRLIVNDNISDSEADTILIKATSPNPAPNAVAGPDQSIHQTDTVTLDGTGSSDPNGDHITYSWQIVSAPNGSQAALSDATAGKPTLDADQAGKYVLRLVVNDGANNSLPDTVVIIAAPVAKLTVTPINPSILQGQKQLFTAIATFGDSTIKDVTTLATWTSSNPAVATIDAAGVATALAAGTTLIHASVGSVVSIDQIMTVTPSTPFPTISGFAPTEGTVGTLVTINGSNFNHSPTTVLFNGTQSVISNLTDNQITTVVPPGAITGPIMVKTFVGTANSATVFSVRLRQDFELAINPQNATISANGSASFIVSLVDKGIAPFTGLVKLSLPNSLSGITGSFNPQYLSLNRPSTLTLSSQQGNQATVTVQGDANIEGSDLSKTVVITLNPQTPGATILRGRVLATKDANPIAGVTVILGTQTVITDGGGNFTIVNAPVGSQVLILNGGTANHDGITYPSALPVAVNIAAGAHNTLPAPIYLHEVKTNYFTQINPSIDTFVTDPEIPNYELRIPAGTVITGWDGLPNTKVSVKPIPVDRLPIPSPPAGVYANEIYMYYFFKPGGGTPSQPIPVKMPNTFQASPGTRVKLWYYDESFTPDPNSNQWKSFGMGTVSGDGRNVIPDPGVGIPKFCCGASFVTAPQSNEVSPPDGTCFLADPIDPYTGAFTYKKNDMGYSSSSLLRITRFYNSGNPVIGPFGKGTSINFNHYLQGSGDALTYTPPEGGNYILSKNADGSYTNINYPFLLGTKAYLNADGTKILKFKDGIAYIFDANGRLMEERDNNGNWVIITRDSNGNITGLNDSYGRIFIISNIVTTVEPLFYTIISSVIDMSGREVRYSYNSNYQLSSVTQPDGSTTNYSYDGAGRIISITNPRGFVEVTNQYDASGRVIQQTHADGGVFNLAYNVVGGSVTQTSVTEPNGGTTTYRLSGAGYSSEIIDAFGQKTTYDRAFSTNGLNSITDPLGRTTTYAYDLNGNTTSITDPVGKVKTYEYDPVLNKPTKITDALGNITTLTYDAKGNLTQILSPKTELTTIGYNSNGLPTTLTDAMGNVSTFEYDEFGNLSRSTDPLGNSAQMEYDFIGRLISAIDPKGKLTLYSYDDMNRVLDITDAMNGKTLFSYDKNGNLLSVTDAKNQTITYTYNVRDKVATMIDQLGKTESYAYDQNDNLASMTDRKGQASAYQYDLKNKATKATYADGTSSNYTYDAIGRLTYINDSVSGSIEYIYGNTGCAACGGAIDKIFQEITPLGSVSYTYDAVGRRASMTVAGQPVVNYAYDSDSRLSNINTTIGGVGQGFSLAHDAIGRRSSLVMPNGATTTYGYDTASRLLNMNHLNSLNAVFESVNYTYDANGNKTSMSRPAVNLPLPATATNTSYNQANQMLTFKDKNISYDSNGNIVSVTNACGLTAYIWDARNRLIGINGIDPSCQPLAASFKYDAWGRRIEKTINGKTIQYLYDGYNIIQEVESGTVSANYIRSLIIDEPLARIKYDGTIRYYHRDALGSIIGLTSEDGQLATVYSYDPFGNISTNGEASDNPFQYTGRENDGTGLYYYRFRYYSPELQRFISEDPMGLVGGINKYSYVDSVGKPHLNTNLYAYTANNPINRIDPLGLDYNDLNISIGWYGIGITFGVMQNGSGSYPYLGGGVMTPGFGIAYTTSSSDPSLGWSVALQGQYGAAGQVGYSFEDKTPFAEYGVGSPGASLTGYYVWGPFFGQKPPQPVKCH